MVRKYKQPILHVKAIRPRVKNCHHRSLYVCQVNRKCGYYIRLVDNSLLC